MLDHIKSIIADIKNIFNKLVASGNYDEISAWQSDMEALDKLNNMMLDALAEIEHTNSQTQKNTSDEVKDSKKRMDDIARSDIDVLRDIGKKSVNQFTGEDLKKAEKWAKKFYKELGTKSPFFRAWFGDWRENDKTPLTITSIPEYIAGNEERVKQRGEVVCKDTKRGDSDGWVINISRQGETNTISHAGKGRLSEYGLSNIRGLIENAVLLDTEVHEHHSNNSKKPETDRIAFDHKLYALGKDTRGSVALYKITVEEIFQDPKHPDYKRFHNLKYIEKVAENIGSLTDENKARHAESTNDVSTTKYSVADLFEFVKKYDAEFQPKPASKIVNADGTPKVMYHGTQSSFTAFDKKKAKSSGYYGKGFYFTESESHAKQYGDSMAVYLDIKNPLEPGKNSISKKQLRKFLESVAENEDYDIWNYGADNIDEIINNIYKDDAFAVIQDINATAIGDFAEAIALFNKVNKTSYDGIVTPTETVVYEPTQIKSVDNIGTYDGSNDDIYFSTKRDAEQKKNQLDIINETNPAPNTYSTWIRTVDDIKTLSETLEDEDWEYEVINPDLTRTDIQNAIESGEITVYSSYPIENGVFVSPSRMEAESYSGNGKVYEKTVDINDVAWIDPTQGQYAKVDVKFATKRLTNDSPLSYNNRAKPNPRSSINWVYKAGLFSVVENKLFHQKISEINQGSKAFEKNADGEYMLPIENKIVFTNGDYNAPYISKVIEVLDEYATNFEIVKGVIFDEERGKTGHREAVLFCNEMFGDGLVIQYKSGVSGAYGWADRKRKGRNRRAIIDDYIREQNRARNDSEVEANQNITPSTKRAASVSEDASNYILDTKEYKEVMKLVDQLYRLTGKKKLDTKAIDRFAGRLLSKSQSQYSREQLTERLSALFDYIANGGNSHKKRTCSYNLTKRFRRSKMSKSKYNYKVYNGKALKRFFENSKMFVLVFLFVAGLITGAAAINSDSTLLQNISGISQSYAALRSEQGFVENCLNSLTVSIIFMSVNIFLGFSLIGYPVIIWLPFIKGLGIGAITGYLYSAFKITGLGYCVLTIYPGAVVAIVALILACNDSAEYSKNAFLKAVRGRGQFEKDETKIYLIRQFIFCGVCAISSIADALFATVFSGFFKI